MLACENTQVTALPLLPAFLEDLNCMDTKITEFPELPATLKYLFCVNCPNLLIQMEENETISEYEARWKVVRESRRGYLAL